MSDDERRTKCYCIIPHRSQPSILVRKVGDRYECPSVWLPWRRLKFFPDHIPHIRQELRHDTSLEMTVLRHLQDLDDVQLCLMEVQSVIGGLPDSYLWLNGGEDVEWVDEQSSQAWCAWKSVSQAWDQSLTIAPWERKGWFGDTKHWMQTHLHEAGYELNGPVDQFKGAWGWSSILKAETNKGTVYLKADYGRPPKEVAVILKLAERWPENVPHIIAADVERSWMLMSDFAGASLEPLDTNHHRHALSLFAKIQRSAAPDIHDWKLLGCPDMTPDNLLRMTKHLIADRTVLYDGKSGLCREELMALETRVPQIEQMLTQLASSVLPSTISNEDFRAGNVIVRGGKYILYDWSSTVISHPLFGINYFLNRMIRSDSEDGFRWRNDLEDVRRHELMCVFLSEWTDYASWDQLVSEFRLCRRLYPLYEAVKCYCDLPFIGTTSPWGAGALAYIPEAVKKLIAALDHQPVIGPSAAIRQ